MGTLQQQIVSQNTEIKLYSLHYCRLLTRDNNLVTCVIELELAAVHTTTQHAGSTQLMIVPHNNNEKIST